MKDLSATVSYSPGCKIFIDVYKTFSYTCVKEASRKTLKNIMHEASVDSTKIDILTYECIESLLLLRIRMKMKNLWNTYIISLLLSRGSLVTVFILVQRNFHYLLKSVSLHCILLPLFIEIVQHCFSRNVFRILEILRTNSVQY